MGLSFCSNDEESAGNAGDQVQSQGQEDPQRRKWQPTPVFLPGESPWTEEPGELCSIGSQRVGHDSSDFAHEGVLRAKNIKATDQEKSEV